MLCYAIPYYIVQDGGVRGASEPPQNGRRRHCNDNDNNNVDNDNDNKYNNNNYKYS